MCGRRPASRARGRAQSLLVAATELPDGFRDSGGQTPGYAQQVCGVDIEPSPPVQTARRAVLSGAARAVRRAARAGVRRRLGDGDAGAAAPSAGDLRPLRPASERHLPAAGFDVEPLRLPAFGDESLAWRQTPRTSLPVTTDVVLIRSGRTVVLVTSYALKQAPDDETARVAAQAAARRLSA